MPGSRFGLERDEGIVVISTRANPELTTTCPGFKLNEGGSISWTMKESPVCRGETAGAAPPP